MSPFHPSPESARIQEDLASLSGTTMREALLDSTSVHKLIPEKYHEHLDELLDSIRAFCKEFGIPNDALKNTETFGEYLHRIKISPERMKEVLSLFERLNYLVTNREPFEEKFSEALEYAERLYHLKEQYDAQLAILEYLKILDNDGTLPTIDGNYYPVPTIEQIAQHLFEQRETLETKREQGFTKLLLVPFGMSLDLLLSTFKRFLQSYKKDHPTFGRLVANTPDHSDLDGWEFLDLDEYYKEADFGDSPKLLYYPKNFHQEKHQAKTKEQILLEQNQDSTTTPGWNVLLLQPSDPSDQNPKGFALIPRDDQGGNRGEKIWRSDIEAFDYPEKYLCMLHDDARDPHLPCYGESGMTPEDWITASITHLMETETPLDDAGNGIESMCYLVGAYFPHKTSVPRMSWDLGIRSMRLEICGVRNLNSQSGVRFCVIL